MKVYNKMKWALGILLVFIIVLITNLIDRDNFNRIRYSIVTIYEDRIVANDLIFEISAAIHKKEIALVKSDTSFFRQKNSQVNDDIQRFIDRYEETKITKEERVAFNSLINHVENLQRLESEYMDSKFRDKSELLSLISDIKDDLYDLSKVQLKEGKRQMSLSEKTMDTIELFTQVEIIFLIVMAVLIQLIVLYQPKDKKQSQAQE